MSVRISSDELIRMLQERKLTVNSCMESAIVGEDEFNEAYQEGALTELDITIRLIKDLAGEY